MVRQFDHLVLTRFNVKLANMAGSAADESWLRERVRRFADDCVPSLAAQTVRDFVWVLLIDVDSPDWLESDLVSVVEAAGLRVSVKGVAGILDGAKLREAISDHLTSEYVLTTRIDNDDIVAAGFIEAIQGAFTPIDDLVIDPPRGAQLDNGKLYLRNYRLGPFISYVEQVDRGVATVLRDAHPAMGEHGVVTTLGSVDPLWLQVIHGGNFANRVEGWRGDPVAMEGAFPTVAFAPVSRMEIVMDRAWRAILVSAVFPKRLLGKAVRLFWSRPRK